MVTARDRRRPLPAASLPTADPLADGPVGTEPVGALLTRLRQQHGLSQLRVAERLCAVSGMPTVSRHEVSRWERGDRVPGAFWIGWLGVVLEVPRERLEAAVAVTRQASRSAQPATGVELRRLWRPPTPDELLATLRSGPIHDLRELAHVWLTGPVEPPPAITPVRTTELAAPAAPEPRVGGEVTLAELRRMDDLVGGVDLASRVDQLLRELIGRLPSISPAGRGQLLRLVAGHAQLVGWLRTDAGEPAAARRAYRVALRAAAAAGDRPLAAYVLASASHHALTTGDPQEALLLARTAQTGAGAEASALTSALLHHRSALALAGLGERRAAQLALAQADQSAERSDPDREPPWLYWLDGPQLTAMTGRCLVSLGRPLRGVRLLARPWQRPGPRATALYGGWLARGYLALGEVEQACRVAKRALHDAVAAGSVRATTELRRLHPLLLRHRDLAAVRGYERITAGWAPYLPAPLWVKPTTAGARPPPQILHML